MLEESECRGPDCPEEADADRDKALPLQLWRSIREGDVDAVKSVLESKCAVDSVSETVAFYKNRWLKGQAIHLAVAVDSSLSAAVDLGKRSEVVSELLKARANVNAEGSYSKGNQRAMLMPIHIAAGAGTRDMVRLLLHAEADPNAYSELHRPDATPVSFYAPLHDAAFLGKRECIRELIDRRANVNIQNMEGYTALMWACKSGHVEIATALLEAGADAAIENYVGLTASRACFATCSAGTAGDITRALVDNGNCPKFDIIVEMLMSQGQAFVAKDLLEATCLHATRNSDAFSDFRVACFLGVAPRTLQSNTSSSSSPTCASLDDPAAKALMAGEKTCWDWLRGNDLTEADVCLCAVENVCSPDILRALARTPGKGVLETKIAHAIVEEAWSSVWLLHLVDLLISISVVIVMCFVAADMRDASEPPAAVLSGSLILYYAKRGMEEGLQVFQAVQSKCFIEYAFSVGTLIDWINICIAVVGCVMLVSFSGAVTELAGIGLFCAAQWMHAMYSLRALERFGPRLLPIVHAVKDTSVFMVIVLCCFGAGIHAYYIAGVRESPSPFYAAFLQIVRLGLLGDFNLHDFEGQDTVFVHNGAGNWEPVDPSPSGLYTLVHAIFFATAVVITVILMNLFIGILSSNYDIYEDRAQELFLRERARIITTYWARFSWCHSRRALPQPDGIRGPYLWLAARKEAKRDSLRSMRAVMADQLNKLNESQQQKMQEMESRLSAQMKEMLHQPR